jgi:hypothetical protein
MITIKETIRAMLLVILPGLWLSSSAFALASSPSAEAQNPVYRVRRRATSTSEATLEQRRELNQFLPNFSGDENLVKAKMPDLTLAMNGLTGRPLGEKSYSAMQTAMNDYLRKRFEDYFLPRYQFVDVETEVVDDVPLEAFELSGGNAISMETTLMFHDPSGDSESVETEIAETFGARTRQRVEPPETFRQSDGVSATANQDVVPSALELELAAGYAWNDLSSFRNHLLVAATIDNLETFNGIGEIESIEGFTTNAQTADEIAVAEEEEEEDTGAEGEVVAQPPERGDVSSPSGSGLNVAAATAGIQQSGTNRMNPLWPALIVGLGVFLFTIIFLGYRRHKATRVANLTDKPDNIMIHISSKESVSVADAGEIEVEDTIFSTSDRKQRKKNKERDLDKEYAKSCMKPVNMSRSSTLNSSFDDEPDENDETEGRKGCFPRRSKRVSLSEQDSMALSTSNDGRKVDLTSPTNSSSWRNPAGLQEEAVDTGDMSKKEKKRFSKYIEAGLTLEEASSQIMRERNQKSRRWLRGDKLPTSPSAMAGTRSGDYGGYHPSDSHRGQRTVEGTSSAMDCISPCAEESLHSELMEDGTAVHYVKKPAYMSLGAACVGEDPSMLDSIRDESDHKKRGSRKINGTARAMVITEASSYGADSYDDDDFDRSMEEAAMGSI